MVMAFLFQQTLDSHGWVYVVVACDKTWIYKECLSGKVAIVAAWHVPSTCQQCTEMTEGWWGIRGGYRDLVSFRNTLGEEMVQSEYRGMQGLHYVPLYVWTLKRKRVNTGKKDKGSRIERIKREITKKLLVLRFSRRWSGAADVFSFLVWYAVSTDVQLRTFRAIVWPPYERLASIYRLLIPKIAIRFRSLTLWRRNFLLNFSTSCK
jgi:hypothetical protein